MNNIGGGEVQEDLDSLFIVTITGTTLNFG